MGLITWIKDKYYNHILNSADELYASNDISRAEQIYMDILGKQPDAAEHLAKMYCEIAESGKDELENLSKIKNLLARAPFGKNDLIPYHTRVVRHIEATADNDFKNKKYARASRFLKAIEIDKRGNTAFAQKNRICSLYVSLNAVEYDTSYKSALSTIDTYCNNVDKEVEDAILGTVTRLHKSQKLDRAYLLANCLAKKSHKQAINDCIAIALDIYKNGNSPFKKTLNAKDILNYIKAENPSDLIDGLEPFVPYSSTFADAYLESGTLSIGNASQDNRLSLFKRVWKHTPDVSLVEKFACPSEPIAKDVISYFIDNTDSLTQKATFTSSLLKMIKLFGDNFYILDTLEQLSKLQFLRRDIGKDIKADYIEVVDKLCKQAKIANKYKQELLARTYDLFGDNTIYNKYISTSISVVKEMTEKDIALSEFSKVWKKIKTQSF